MHSLDDYRAVMAALDAIEASPVASPRGTGGGELWLLATETRRLVERMRGRAEDLLFEDHARLGFESERPELSDLPPAPQPEQPAPANRGAELREAILASDEPTKDLAERLGLTIALVGRIRAEAGNQCAFLSGSALTAEQRRDIATSRAPTRALAARYRIGQSLVKKLQMSGGELQGHICAPAEGASE